MLTRIILLSFRILMDPNMDEKSDADALLTSKGKYTVLPNKTADTVHT